MKKKPFEVWFAQVRIEAMHKNVLYLIQADDPLSYFEYYEDGDSPENVVKAEIHAARIQCKQGTQLPRQN